MGAKHPRHRRTGPRCGAGCRSGRAAQCPSGRARPSPRLRLAAPPLHGAAEPCPASAAQRRTPSPPTSAPAAPRRRRQSCRRLSRSQGRLGAPVRCPRGEEPYPLLHFSRQHLRMRRTDALIDVKSVRLRPISDDLRSQRAEYFRRQLVSRPMRAIEHELQTRKQNFQLSSSSNPHTSTSRRDPS